MELNRYIETIVTAGPVEREDTTSPRAWHEAQLDQDLRQGLSEIANGDTHIPPAKPSPNSAKNTTYEVRLSS